MLAFILTRLANTFLVMLAVAFVAFSLFNFVGDPVTNMLGENAPPDRKADLRQSLGLDAPMPVQFLRFLQHAVRGDFGMSFRNLQPVSSVLMARLPATLELSLMAVLLALGLGVPAGEGQETHVVAEDRQRLRDVVAHAGHRRAQSEERVAHGEIRQREAVDAERGLDVDEP